MEISASARGRIADAVKAAEATTDGEIATIAARQSDAYHDVGLHWAALGMFLVLAVQAAVPRHFVGLLDMLAGGGWGRDWPVWLLLTAQLVMLVIVFLILRFVFAIPRLRMTLTPRATMAEVAGISDCQANASDWTSTTTLAELLTKATTARSSGV